MWISMQIWNVWWDGREWNGHVIIFSLQKHTWSYGPCVILLFLFSLSRYKCTIVHFYLWIKKKKKKLYIYIYIISDNLETVHRYESVLKHFVSLTKPKWPQIWYWLLWSRLKGVLGTHTMLWWFFFSCNKLCLSTSIHK